MAGVSREQFLSRITEALEKDRLELDLPDASGARVVDADRPPTELFVKRAEQAGMALLWASSPEEARNRVIRTAQSMEARSVLLAGPSTPADELLRTEFASAGIHMLDPTDPDAAFEADLGVTGVHAAIAETGSLVIHAQPGTTRLASLAVPAHIAIVLESQIVPDLLDWAEREKAGPPATGCVLITGPSKTGDIEMNLVTGVHGPGDVHVVLMTGH